MPEIGELGQQKLLASKVLLLGAGGLGSPAALYLAAAGVGTLGIVDKRRSSALEVRQSTIIGGPVEGKIALLFDDMISTAGSICGAARLPPERRGPRIPRVMSLTGGRQLARHRR